MLSVREWEFVQAAKAVGGSDVRILAQHVLPNITAPIIGRLRGTTAASVSLRAGLSV